MITFGSQLPFLRPAFFSEKTNDKTDLTSKLYKKFADEIISKEKVKWVNVTQLSDNLASGFDERECLANRKAKNLFNSVIIGGNYLEHLFRLDSAIFLAHAWYWKHPQQLIESVIPYLNAQSSKEN